MSEYNKLVLLLLATILARLIYPGFTNEENREHQLLVSRVREELRESEEK